MIKQLQYLVREGHQSQHQGILVVMQSSYQDRLGEKDFVIFPDHSLLDMYMPQDVFSAKHIKSVLRQ